MPYVVDANVMNSFQQERVAGAEGDVTNSLNSLMTACCIALDDGGHCQQEWIDCAGGTFPLALADWVADMLVSQRIRLFSFCTDAMHKELGSLGIPKKDHKWVRLAVGSKSPIIVTDDIDLFDPTKKSSSSSIKDRIKDARSGPVSKYLKKRHDIIVACPRHVPGLLGAATAA